MSLRPPPPITVPWALKPLDSAQVGLEVLPGGRRRFHIRHDVLRGVTPEMLLWWFGHLEGDMELEGRSVSRYRVWHPRDHVAVRYVRRLPDGSIGPGAQLHIQEFFDARPENKIDIIATITRLDVGGFHHVEHVAGIAAACMDYRFTRVDGGTLFENELVVGVAAPWARLVNPIVKRVFPDAKGHAWLRHNVEEVGSLEHFLPRLFDEHAGSRPEPVTAG